MKTRLISFKEATGPPITFLSIRMFMIWLGIPQPLRLMEQSFPTSSALEPRYLDEIKERSVQIMPMILS